jgi:hypothetical protein
VTGPNSGYRQPRAGHPRSVKSPLRCPHHHRSGLCPCLMVSPTGTLRMLSRLVGVVVMGHSAHCAIAGYARPPRAPRPSLCDGPRASHDRRLRAESFRGRFASGARPRALGGSGDRPVARALRQGGGQVTIARRARESRCAPGL